MHPDSKSPAPSSPFPARRSRPSPTFIRAHPFPSPRHTKISSPLCPIRHSPIPTASATPSSQPQPRLKRLAASAAAALLTAIATFAPPVQPARSAQLSTPSTTTTHPLNCPRLNTSTTAPLRLRPQTSPTKLNTSSSSSSSSSSAGGHGLDGQSFLVAGTAALLASAAAVAITHPIDTLKTRRQANQSLSDHNSLSTIPSLYKGVFSNILKEAPNAAIYLATYEIFKTSLLGLPLLSTFPLVAMCLAGMLGDAVGSIVRVPAEIINKRLQLGLSTGWKSAVRDAFLSPTGVDATFASWAAVLWRDVPYGGLQIAGYEAARGVLAGAGLAGLPLGIVAGAGAGLVAAVLTTPADVLVTRMTTQSPQCYLETRKYMSPVATCRRIIREEGFGALWTGALHRGLFYMPMIGLFFAAYEWFKYAILNPSVAAAAGTAAIGTVVTSSKLILGIAVSLVPSITGRFPLHLLVLALGHVLVSRVRIVRKQSHTVKS